MTEPSYRPRPALEPTPVEVAKWLGGELRDAASAPARLSGLATLGEAQESDISFVAGEKALKDAASSRAGLLIVARRMEPAPGGEGSSASAPPDWAHTTRARIVVDEVWESVARLMQRLYPAPAPPAGVHATAVLEPGVQLGSGASVGPYCVIGAGSVIEEDAILGPHCILAPGSRIGAGTRLAASVTLACPAQIGARVIIHPGVVIGADGFKFEIVRGRPIKVPQVGTVVIEDDVEIGANSTIDRAFLYETRIGRGTKIDNLVQIAHNVRIGEGCMMAAQVGIAGSTQIGKGVLMGGQAGAKDNMTLGDGAIVGAQAGVVNDVAAGVTVHGMPAQPAHAHWRIQAAMARLPELLRRVRALEQRLSESEKPQTPQDKAPPA